MNNRHKGVIVQTETESMKSKIVWSFLFVITTVCSFSQGVPIGHWKSYFPFNDVIDITYNRGVAYGITANALIIHDYNDNTIERLTEVDALSDIGLSAVGFNTSNNGLVIGYVNGNVDLIQGNETINLFQIRESTITGDKKVNHIYNKGDFAYLSCGFGIVVYNIKKKEVKDTYIIGLGGSQVRVNQLTIQGGKIYAATENGLYEAPENSAFLTDFNSWTRVASFPNFLNEIKHVGGTQNTLIMNVAQSPTSDSVYVFKNGTWSSLVAYGGRKIYSVSASNGKLMVNYFDTVYAFDTSLNLTHTITNYDGFWKPRCNAITYDGTYFYIADKQNANVRFKNNFVANWKTPEFMYSTNVLDIEIEDGNLWGSTGSLVGGGWNKTYNNDGAFHYDIREDKWRIYNAAYQYNGYNFSNGSMNDFVGMVVNPNEPTKGYVCTFSAKGVAELSNNKVITAYDTTNSELRISTSHNDRIAVKDGDFDENENLWLANSWVKNPLVLKTKSGVWKSFFCGSAFQNRLTASVTVDKQNGYKWMVFKDYKVLVYNDNGTPLDETDDQYKEISNGAANGNLNSTPICIAEDKEGEIWIGTDEGIYVFYTPSELFSSSSFEVQKIKVTLDGNVELLLESERVTCITIDGANRKWIGTEGAGIFVLSSDGTEQELGFTEENSPLLSNNIHDIAIDDETGEVFISTDKGLISYKGEATEGKPTYEDVYAYPNPVPPGYQGKIAVKGLVADSEVRITDIYGNVVFTSKSVGGQAIWEGKKLNGERASSGVYLVFMTSPEGTSSQVSKILFMK